MPKCSTKYRILPQNTKEYWNEERKRKHSLDIKTSDLYYDAITKRNTSGDKNSMFGKKHSSSTKMRMSESRKNKCRENATAWKGGKSSLTRLIKGHIQHEVNWSYNVFKKDFFKCTKCGCKGSSKNKLDAHHILPVNNIIKRLIKELELEKLTKYEIFDKIKDNELLLDKNLKNGTTLCRNCHRIEHRKQWGSHTCQAITQV